MSQYHNSYKEKYLRIKALRKNTGEEHQILTELTLLKVEQAKMKEILVDVMLSAASLETTLMRTNMIGDMTLSHVQSIGINPMMLDDVGNLSLLMRVANERIKLLHSGLEYELEKGPIEENTEKEIMNSILHLKREAHEFANAALNHEDEIKNEVVEVTDVGEGGSDTRLYIVGEDEGEIITEELDRSLLLPDNTPGGSNRYQGRRLRRYHASRVMNSSIDLSEGGIRASLPAVDDINFVVLRSQLNNIDQLMVRGLDNNALLALAAEEDLDLGVGWRGSKKSLGRRIRELIRRSS